MLLDVLIGFVVVVVGTYVGATAALRGFFGREYYDPRTGEQVDNTESTDLSDED